jgi:magnesium chelatase subunit I
LVPGRWLLEQVGPLPGLAHVMVRLGVEEGAETHELAAAALEFALEGLFLNRRISKDDSTDGGIVYGA